MKTNSKRLFGSINKNRPGKMLCHCGVRMEWRLKTTQGKALPQFSVRSFKLNLETKIG